MIDFTQKGTKLPVIPKGTKFKWLRNGSFHEPCESNHMFTFEYSNFISFGGYVHNNKEYVICDNKEAQKNHLIFLIELSTIERLAKEQGMCNTNNEQMKTQVTLNDNGDVTVTDNDTTTIHSKETALQIYEVVKVDLNKPKLEETTYGRWYQNKTSPQIIVFYEKDDRVFGSVGYGFDVDGRFGHANNWSLKSFKEDWQPAPTETVETALRNEFIRLGGKVGVKFYSLNNEGKQYEQNSKYLIENTDFVYDPIENSLYYQKKGDWQKHRVFCNGIFATIIQPETISIQEAEKRTGCKIK